MAQKHTQTIQALATLDRPMTFAARLEEIKAINLQAHCDAALAARVDFEDRLPIGRHAQTLPALHTV